MKNWLKWGLIFEILFLLFLIVLSFYKCDQPCFGVCPKISCIFYWAAPGWVIFSDLMGIHKTDTSFWIASFLVSFLLYFFAGSIIGFIIGKIKFKIIKK